ncbi:hypothetical protein [Nocardia farcinica]|uniref:Uncharacterized protein n=1 Tax=Nocardia farcinica (strain IFM 10152) TaxID=247156 RepID=Q5YZP6_NOCFA|nr:hypothetical protein [Nocardia farcinica]MBF6573763.1 hypothetical protein [Nocardia farcinica]BAD56345.1 hypothetical protein NFA_15000 [Nocardia farcinica IFM 10152]
MPERTPRLTAEELEALREATLQHYEAAGYPDELTDRLRAYTDEPDGGLINLIDMAIELARSHEAALARIAELEGERARLVEGVASTAAVSASPAVKRPTSARGGPPAATTNRRRTKVPDQTPDRMSDEAYVLVFEDRDPPGPNVIGPFSSREAVFEYADSLKLNSAAYEAWPLARDPRTPEEDRPVDAQEAIERADREDRNR